jgi:uncharacterized protein (TIGR00661 family)
MATLKIVVAQNLTGSGHKQRIQAFMPELQQECEVITVGSGRPPGAESLPEKPLDHEFAGLTWKYGHRGIDLSHAALQLLALPRLRADRCSFAETLRQISPDGIWADFEFIACGASQKHRQALRNGESPIFTQRVDHHAAFLSRFVPRPPWAFTNIPTDWFLRTFCQADHYEGFHFKSYTPGRPDLRINTPIIRTELRQRAARNEVWRGEHILGYLPGYDIDTLTELLRPHTKRPWVIYHQAIRDIDSPLPHVTFKPTGFRKEYLDDLVSCHSAVITTGFQLPAELLYLKKFFIGTPQRCQPEQGYNAAALKELGVPIVRSLTRKSLPFICEKIESHSDRLAAICEGDMEQQYPDQTKEIVREFIRRIRAARQRWHMGGFRRPVEEPVTG